MKRFPTIILISAAIAAAALTVSCGGRGSGKNQQDSNSADVAQAQVATVPDTIAPLVPGEVHLKNDAEAFGEELHLKGDTVLQDEIFKVGVSTMILKDSLLLVCCEDDRPFRMYSLPENLRVYPATGAAGLWSLSPRISGLTKVPDTSR